MALVGICEPAGAGEPTVAVDNQANMLGLGTIADLAPQGAFIDPVQKSWHIHIFIRFGPARQENELFQNSRRTQPKMPDLPHISTATA